MIVNHLNFVSRQERELYRNGKTRHGLVESLDTHITYGCWKKTQLMHGRAAWEMVAEATRVVGMELSVHGATSILLSTTNNKKSDVKDIYHPYYPKSLEQ